MPVLDMPLDELKRYEGRNPRPEDFEAYWTRAIEELEDVSPRVELVAYGTFRNAEAFELRFDGVRGARIYAKYTRPRGGRSLPALLHFHGYTWRSPDWSELLGWVGEGFAIAALDCRGQAGFSEDTTRTRGNTLHGHIVRGLDEDPDDLYFRQVFLDTRRMAEIVASFDEVDAARIGAFGGSQGGGLTLACAALSPLVRRAAPTFPFLSDYRRVWEMDLAKDAYAELKQWFRQRDPLHEREEWLWNRLGYIDVQHLAPRITASTLFTATLQDAICPPSTQFAAFNKLGGPKELLVYPDYGHEGLHGHGDLVHRFLLEL